ncbi:CoA ester lyase [Shimia sp.]|uniref:HpcH/HpaI aldolase/citrate lyase family protein n=1 Tax=Shimia sp. TaxID=1954381 RepID=UPI0035694990
MSFHSIEQAPGRLNRSELAIPGSQPQMFEKAAKSDVDVIFLDLEDAVAPDEKEQARKNVIEALNDIDWNTKTMSVRINGLDTHYMYRDVVDLVEQAGERLDLIMIPKVGTASDVYALDMLVTQIEDAMGHKKRIGFEHIIETALGMQNVSEIAAASKRNESLHFGVADYAASTRARSTIIGGVNPHYAVLTDPAEDGGRGVHWGDMWHYALSRMVVAARANGLRPIDGPFGDFSDPDGYRAAARRAAALGCEGKWAIHPSQIALANEVMSPSASEVDRAQRILSAMAEAEANGKGAVSLDGRLIDYASIRQAEVLVQKALQIGA